MTTIDIRQQLALLSPERRRVVELLLRQEQQAPRPQAIPIPRQSDRTNAPLSFSQQRLWLLDQLEPGIPAYNLPQAIRLTGWLSVSTLARSLNTIIQRHESLRTTFATVGERQVQVVAPMLRLPLPMVDLQGLPAPAREAEVQRLSKSEARYSFDLARGPLLRAVLLRLDAHEHLLLLNMHHVISDRWSMGVFVRELLALYKASALGRPALLSTLPVQYPDFAIWQRQQLQGPVLQGHMDYWRAQLADAPPLLTLPTDRPRPPIQTFRGAARAVPLPGSLVESLRALSQHEGSTLFMTLLAAFKLLLARYAAQDDISVGTFIANRTHEELEPLIGFFVNTLVLRTNLSGDLTFRELLRRVRETALGAYAHQDVPFEMLLEELHPSRVLNRTPMFQVMLVLQNTPRPRIELPDLTIDILARPPSSRSNFDLTLWITEQPDGLVCNWEYSTDLFDGDTIARMQGHFQNVLEAIAADPDQRISELPLLSADEQRRLLASNHLAPAMPQPSCVHHSFEAQAARSPDAVAVVGEHQHLTYVALNRRANQLAHHLHTLDLQPEAPVAVCMERSVELVIALLGVLKAGAAYVPLDPAYPHERLAFILQDCQAQVLITSNDQRPTTNDQRLGPGLVGSLSSVIDLRADWPRIAAAPDSNPCHQVQPEQLAYVIYTSGSTGTPKGVLVQHRSLAHYTALVCANYGYTAGDRCLQFASISFDTSAEEIYPTLTSGATLVLRNEWMLGSPALFLRTCGEWAISVLDLPTSYWHLLTVELGSPEATVPESLRLVLIGGERALPERLARWREQVDARVQLVNTYGPTEATIVTTTHELADTDHSRRELPIGKPIAQAQTYILDRHMRLVPPGVVGELHIGGEGLARGYLGRPELTAERFVPNPFTDERRKTKDKGLDSSFVLRPSSGTRLYRTGDLARYRPDGTLEFVGRIDGQVKLRGYRIELGEIEAVLRRHPNVGECVVLAREDVPGDTRLVAYVVPAETLNDERRTMNGRERSSSSSIVYRPSSVVGELRSFLKERLPDYMLPSAFVLLDALPTTPNGKLDKGALPAPDQRQAELAEMFVAPRTLVEQRLAEIWAGVLGVRQVSVYDNFFALGGHSLLMAQLMFQLRDAFQVNPPLRILFEQPTLMELALLIEETLVQEIEALSEEEAQLRVMWASN